MLRPKCSRAIAQIIAISWALGPIWINALKRLKEANLETARLDQQQRLLCYYTVSYAYTLL